MVDKFIEDRVYKDKYDRLYFCNMGYLHTSTGFKYKDLREVNKEEYNLTRLTKEEMIEKCKSYRDYRKRIRYNLYAYK